VAGLEVWEAISRPAEGVGREFEMAANNSYAATKTNYHAMPGFLFSAESSALELLGCGRDLAGRQTRPREMKQALRAGWSGPEARPSASEGDEENSIGVDRVVRDEKCDSVAVANASLEMAMRNDVATPSQDANLASLSPSPYEGDQISGSLLTSQLPASSPRLGAQGAKIEREDGGGMG
jgi:hypothetical protein